MALTELQLKNLKPKEKRYLVRDDQGLYIEVNTSGRKYWKVRYMVDGKSRKVSLGEYPHIGLREARQKRDEIRGQVVTGDTPKQARTFQSVAEEWFEIHIKGTCADSYIETVKSRLMRFLYPTLGDKPITEIGAPLVLTLLQGLQATGSMETTHKVKQIAGQVFRYGIAIGECERDITADLKGALKPNRHKNYGAARNPEEAKAVIQALNAYRGGVVVGFAMWFSAYTFCRPGEIRHAEWTEINYEYAEWRIPPEKMKLRRIHIVPLATQVIELLEKVRAITGHGRYIFPNGRALIHGDRPMSENAVRIALRTMGFSNEQMTAHGFRAMASTLLNENGFQPTMIERQLAHVERNSVRAAYNHAEYLAERRAMMQWWADFLDGLIKA